MSAHSSTSPRYSSRRGLVSRRQVPPAGRAGLFLLALLLVRPAAAEDPPRAGWNAGTVARPAAPAGNAPPDAISLRVYEGFNSLGPVFGHEDGAVAVDVSARLLACPDGSRIVTAVTIGGADYELGTTCPSGRPGVTAPAPASARAPAPAAVPATTPPPTTSPTAAPQRPVLRCSASDWNCSPR